MWPFLRPRENVLISRLPDFRGGGGFHNLVTIIEQLCTYFQQSVTRVVLTPLLKVFTLTVTPADLTERQAECALFRNNGVVWNNTVK